MKIDALTRAGVAPEDHAIHLEHASGALAGLARSVPHLVTRAIPDSADVRLGSGPRVGRPSGIADHP